MNVLKQWLLGKGFETIEAIDVTNCVVFGRTKTVFINNNSTRENRLISLLHEAGHVDIHMKRKRNRNRTISGISLNEQVKEIGRFTQKSKRRLIAVLTEEIDAWDKGWKIGRKLGIKISKRRYEIIRIRALMTYTR